MTPEQLDSIDEIVVDSADIDIKSALEQVGRVEFYQRIEKIPVRINPKPSARGDAIYFLAKGEAIGGITGHGIRGLKGLPPNDRLKNRERGD